MFDKVANALNTISIGKFSIDKNDIELFPFQQKKRIAERVRASADMTNSIDQHTKFPTKIRLTIYNKNVPHNASGQNKFQQATLSETPLSRKNKPNELSIYY